jgi:hypothetical protein
LWKLILPPTNVQIFNRTFIFENKMIIVLKEKIINSIFLINLKYNDSIHIGQTHSTTILYQSIGYKISIQKNEFYFVFGTVSTKPIPLNQHIYNISLLNILPLTEFPIYE